MPVISYTITVTYPPNVKRMDCEKQLNDLLEVVTAHGLSADGIWMEEEE